MRTLYHTPYENMVVLHTLHHTPHENIWFLYILHHTHYNNMCLGWKEPEQLRLEAAALALPGVADHALAASVRDHILEQKQNEPLPEGDERFGDNEDVIVKEIENQLASACKAI